MGPTHIRIRPAGPVTFRWGGLYTPAVAGAKVWAETEPVPLPTGFFGAYAAADSDVRESLSRDGRRRYSAEDVARAVEEVFGRVTAFRGPYLLIEGAGENVVCLHSYPKGLLCVRPSGPALKHIPLGECMGSFVGIGLKRGEKVVFGEPGLIYTKERVSLDCVADAVQRELSVRAREASIAMDVAGEPKARDGPYTVAVGADSTPAIVEVAEGAPLLEVMETLATKSLLRGEGVLYFATPALLTAEVAEEIIRALDKASPPEVINKVLEHLRFGWGVAKPDPRSLIGAGHRLTLSIIGTGFDMRASMPRPQYPAIMPGSAIPVDLSGVSPHQRDELIEGLRRGLGEMSKYGWGTVLLL